MSGSGLEGRNELRLYCDGSEARQFLIECLGFLE